MTTTEAPLVVATYRVVHGWSCYEDFADEREAVGFANTIAARPVKDRLCRVVAVLDLTTLTPYKTVFWAERDVSR